MHHLPAKLTYDVRVSARSPVRSLGWSFVLLLWSYVWPTVWDVWNSFRRVSLFTGADRGAGFANYDYALGTGSGGRSATR